METRPDNSRLLLLALVGILAFTVAGVVNGLILLQFELLLGSVVEGAIWGFILGFAVRDRFPLWKVMLAAILANVLSYFLGANIGLSTPIPRFLIYMIMGIIMGLVFSGILGKGRGALLFAGVGGIIFLIGGFLFDSLALVGSALLNFVERILGPNGWVLVAPAFTGIFKGLAMGLGLGLFERRQEEKN